MGERRSLSNVGGPAAPAGDPELARTLVRCLDVDTPERLPFTHGFHAYPARLHPEIARRALEAFTASRVLDPFVGSGTTAVEAVRAGLEFTGVDVSKVALEIAWIRTRVLPPEKCRDVERAGARIAGRAGKAVQRDFTLPPWAERERAWYTPHTLREIVALQDAIEEVPDPVLRRILVGVLSSVVVKLSKQATDSAAVPDRNFHPWRPGSAFRFFSDRSVELTTALLRLSSDLYKRKVAFREPALTCADARTAKLEGTFDLVLSSPPYPGVYDYSRHQRRRLPLYGDDGSFAERHEIGARRDPRNYAVDLAKALANVPLAPGGRILLLIGDGTLDGKPAKADAIVRAVPGFRVAASASQGRPGGRREHLMLLTR